MIKPLAVLMLASTCALACATTAQASTPAPASASASASGQAMPPAPTRNGALRIDATSRESAHASFMAMMKRLPKAKQEKLAAAVLVINMEGVKSVHEAIRDPELQSPSIERIKDTVAGMTADEIIAYADRTGDVQVKVQAR